MTDLCARGGLLKLENFEAEHTLTESNTIEKYANGEMQKYFQEYTILLKKIMDECPNHANKIEEQYYGSRIVMVHAFSQDEATGELCGYELKSNENFELEYYKKPYIEWEAYQYESSCVAELDPIYREFSKSVACDSSNSSDYSSTSLEMRKAYEIFKKTGNPTCGSKNFAEIYEKNPMGTTTTTGNQSGICAQGGLPALT